MEPESAIFVVPAVAAFAPALVFHWGPWPRAAGRALSGPDSGSGTAEWPGTATDGIPAGTHSSGQG